MQSLAHCSAHIHSAVHFIALESVGSEYGKVCMTMRSMQFTTAMRNPTGHTVYFTAFESVGSEYEKVCRTICSSAHFFQWIEFESNERGFI